jgi:hypothetical protein
LDVDVVALDDDAAELLVLLVFLLAELAPQPATTSSTVRPANDAPAAAAKPRRPNQGAIFTR